MRFVRLTTEARTALVRARDVSAWAGHRSVGADAVALGALLVLEVTSGDAGGAIDVSRARRHMRSRLSRDDALDAAALGDLGIELTEVRRATDKSFGHGAFDHADGVVRPRQLRRRLPFTTGARWLLRAAAREAESLRQARVSERHILLVGLRHSPHLREALTLEADLATVRRALQAAPAPA